MESINYKKKQIPVFDFSIVWNLNINAEWLEIQKAQFAIPTNVRYNPPEFFWKFYKFLQIEKKFSQSSRDSFMKKNILDILAENIGSMTKSQKKAGEYILNNSMQAAFSTVEQMAQSIGVSTATIIRLTTQIGCSGFAEFQKALQNTLQTKMGPKSKLQRSNFPENAQDSLIEKIINSQLDNINQTYADITSEQILKAEQLLSKAKRIFVVGCRTSHGVAHYLNFNLNRLLGNSELVDSDNYPEVLAGMGEGHVLIVITMPRYVKKVTTLARIAKTRKVSIIGISDGFLSPVEPYSDILFRTQCASLSFHNSLISAMLVADILIGVATSKNKDLGQKRFNDMEDFHKAFETFPNK